jgi:hypothetical protein
MKLYLVHAEHDGINMDLIVAGHLPGDVVRHWRAYYADWDRPKRVKVWTLPTTPLPGVVEWSTMPSQEFEAC